MVARISIVLVTICLVAPLRADEPALEGVLGPAVIAQNRDGPDDENVLLLAGTLGYRHQKPDGRFVFRVRLTPLIPALPVYLGLSAGYAF